MDRSLGSFIAMGSVTTLTITIHEVGAHGKSRWRERGGNLSAEVLGEGEGKGTKNADEISVSVSPKIWFRLCVENGGKNKKVKKYTAHSSVGMSSSLAMCPTLTRYASTLTTSENTAEGKISGHNIRQKCP